MRHTLFVVVWLILIGLVVVGSLLPAGSPVLTEVGRLHLSDRMLHFFAYLAVSAAPVTGFRNRRTGILAGLSMILLGVLLEAAQHFSPGRAVELGDVIANSAGVGCGVLLPWSLRYSLGLIPPTED